MNLIRKLWVRLTGRTVYLVALQAYGSKVWVIRPNLYHSEAGAKNQLHTLLKDSPTFIRGKVLTLYTEDNEVTAPQ